MILAYCIDSKPKVRFDLMRSKRGEREVDISVCQTRCIIHESNFALSLPPLSLLLCLAFMEHMFIIGEGVSSVRHFGSLEFQGSYILGLVLPSEKRVTKFQLVYLAKEILPCPLSIHPSLNHDEISYKSERVREGQATLPTCVHHLSAVKLLYSTLPLSLPSLSLVFASWQEMLGRTPLTVEAILCKHHCDDTFFKQKGITYANVTILL